MTEILCRWLNEEVSVEPKLSGSTFAEQFSNGYLFGVVLHKHGLQDDFEQFSKGWSSEAKLNNFLKLEPTFRLLEIPFNINMAHDVMTEKPGVATRLMYQLFVALNRKKQRQLTGPSLECMRPSGRAQLERIETGMFQARLKNQTSRQVDLDFEALIQKFHKRHLQHVELVAKEEEEAEERTLQDQREACLTALERSRKLKERQLQLYSKLKPLSPGKKQAGKTSPRKSTRAELQARERTQMVADETRASIDAFEATLRHSAPPPIHVQQQQTEQQPRPFSTPDQPPVKTTPAKRNVTGGPSADYISQIRKRVQDDTTARKEREKRRRKVLVEQMNALQEQEEVKREKLLVDRLMRQCQQERRIATQLMHIRKEKDAIRNNRIQQQKQYEQQRAKEFEEALNREAERARQAELERRSQLQHHLELHHRFLAEKAEKNYQKHYHLCQEVLLQVVDFSVKLAHYRELTQGLVPAKLVRDWKTLFIAGRPLFEEEGGTREEGEGRLSSLSSSSGSKQGERDKERLLDETDFHEYRSALCEWTPPPSLEDQLPRPLNPILSHVVYRLLNMVDPPRAPPTPPQFPHFFMKACFVGKPFTGKSTVLQRLTQCAGVTVLCVEQLLTKAVDIYMREKQAFDRLLSPSAQETAPVILGDNEDPLSPSHLAPSIAVEPSSSARLQGPLHISQEGEEEGGAGAGGGGGTGGETGSADEKKEEDTKPGNTLVEHLSPLAALGLKAYTAMASGLPVDDHTVIGIISEELRSLPDGSAWVLDSYPVTVEQAKLLASALTGQSKPLPQLSRNFKLLVEPENREEELHAVSGLDLVLHFSASTEVVLQRASQHDGEPQATDKLDQIQHRLLSYDENWPGLRRWYQQFRNLSTINANRDIESVCSAAQENIQEIINKAKQADAMKKLGLPDYLLASGSMLSLSSRSMTRISHVLPSKKKPQTPRARKRRPSSAESPGHKLHTPTKALGKKRTRKSPTPQREQDQLKPKESESGIFMPVNPSAEPGSAEWQYCSLSLGKDLAKGLAGKWPGVEETYVGTLKGVFRLLRGEREAICHYFYLRRCEFSEYLRRPDHKQEFLQQWQQSYNTLPAHLRREDAMKAELHHRVDDLCDKLWDICDCRKGEAEGEKKRVAEDRWLEDHLGLLSNHYISLMQVELDKFQDTVLLLKDYYNGMEGHVPDELPKIGRMPLIELPPTERPEPPASATSSVHSMRGTEGEEAVSTTATKTAISPSHETPKRRVPLLPRQPPSEPAEEKGVKKKGGATPFSPPPPAEDFNSLELDQQLIVHAYNTAIATVFNLLSSELKVLDAAIEKASQPAVPSQPEKPPEPKEEKGAKGAKGKKDKAKSPPGKKGKGSPAKDGGKGVPVPERAPETPAPTLSAEEASKRQRLLHMKREHKAAIQHEECTVKLHLELIKTKAVDLVTDLKVKARNMHVEMEDWIGQCYKKEVASVSNTAEVLRQAIECEEKLLHELQLPGPVFQIQQSMMTYVPSPPSTPPPPCETSLPDKFTVHQLLSLHQQFSTVAPSGFMLSSEFVDTLLAFADKTVGDDLPENLCGLTKEQVESMCKLVYGNSTEYMDWRQFLTVVAQPWPLPTPQQLVAALQLFTAVAPAGTVSREQYSGVQTWLVADVQSTPEGYSRAENLKEAFFSIYADPVTQQLDYREMLLYLCADPDPKEGLFKALSVAVGQPITFQQANDSEQAILLQDFHKVLVHGLYKGDTGVGRDDQTVEGTTAAVSIEHLLELFLRLSPGNPSEVTVGALLSNPTALEYLDSCNRFSLPDLTEVTKLQLEQSEAD